MQLRVFLFFIIFLPLPENECKLLSAPCQDTRLHCKLQYSCWLSHARQDSHATTEGLCFGQFRLLGYLLLLFLEPTYSISVNKVILVNLKPDCFLFLYFKSLKYCLTWQASPAPHFVGVDHSILRGAGQFF